ncbi:MAG: DUF1501 domain-containing protein [Myxococcales bacterium]|nr:DUF1501 domain-containing protein [Myxococcales bacterium]
MGGFDTHGNHDRDQMRLILQLFGGIHQVMELAKSEGLDQNIIMVVTSDFGRGPHYNGERDNAGKDHWPITSAFFLGAGIPGDRVLGATDAEQLARPVDASTLEVADGGVVIRPHHIHRALRRLAAMDGHEIADAYPLAGEDLPLFG